MISGQDMTLSVFILQPPLKGSDSICYYVLYFILKTDICFLLKVVKRIIFIIFAES